MPKGYWALDLTRNRLIDFCLWRSCFDSSAVESLAKQTKPEKDFKFKPCQQQWDKLEKI